MSNLPNTPSAPSPDACPNTWYAVAFSADLKPGKILPVTLAGQDLILWRTKDGIPHAHSAYCPHLGAHLGYGGAVRDDQLVCSFHKFTYNSEGICTKTSHGAPPHKGRLAPKPVIETNNLIFVWHDNSGAPPDWTPPIFDSSIYRAHSTWQQESTGHPLDNAENPIDWIHLPVTHNAPVPTLNKPLLFDGPNYVLDMSIKNFWYNFTAECILTVSGPGIVVAQLVIPQTRISALEIFSWTPTSGNQMTSRKVTYATFLGDGIPRIPIVVEKALAAIVGYGSVRNIRRDLKIFTTRRYPKHAHLTSGEEDLAACRRWEKQFFESRQPDPVLRDS
ncbi:Rieske 2Fe-2S domain-containing protein [Streptomyces virginiae]|uniref:Rieske 2Fe-2S domain-containing protein n=1 Tax=Streptomyces virginiae TaxID=1961 RepID=UPI0036C21322